MDRRRTNVSHDIFNIERFKLYGINIKSRKYILVIFFTEGQQLKYMALIGFRHRPYLMTITHGHLEKSSNMSCHCAMLKVHKGIPSCFQTNPKQLATGVTSFEPTSVTLGAFRRALM